MLRGATRGAGADGMNTAERGFITCKTDGQAERRLPLDDIRAVIIAARGVTISSNFLSGLLETDAIALHGDERYQP